MIIRCESCGGYFSYSGEVMLNMDGHVLFRCPNKHFSAFKVVNIRTPAIALTDAKFLEVNIQNVETEDLVARELTWVQAQDTQVYDCGFLAAHGVDHPSLTFQSLKTPEKQGVLEDESGMILDLIISPNGIPYYKERK